MEKKRADGMSRRDFGVATAATGFAILSSKSGIAETNSETLKIGLIGCGGRGGGAVRDCLSGNDNVKIVGMADVFEDKLKSKRAEMEAQKDPKIASKVDINDDMCFVGLDAYKKLLETDIDIIIHGTPPYARPKHIAAAVDAGKHIFTEKPIAVDPVGVRLFMDAAKKAKKKKLSFVCGTQRRHQKSYIDTIKRIEDGAIGEVLAARAYWCGSLPFCHERKPEWSDLEYRLRNWYNYVWVCGDNIVEQHIHNIDVINWVMGGPPKRVFASGGRVWKPKEEKYGDLYDHYSCDFEYSRGVHMISMCRHFNNSDGDVSEWIVGTKKIIRANQLAKDDISPYVQEHKDFIASIRGEGEYLNEGERCAESTLTAIMGRMSAFTGKKISFREAMKSDLSIVPEDLDFGKSYPVGPLAVPGT